MPDINDFYRSIRETGQYVTPPEAMPARAVNNRTLAAMRFYMGVLGGVIVRGSDLIRRRQFTVDSFGLLSWQLIHGVERLGTEVSAKGFEAMRGIDRRPAVIVANHMSLIETMLLPACIFANGPVAVVAKRSLVRYPWFGRILEASAPILVDRVNPRQDLADVLEQGTRCIAEGRSVLLFPQGTRLAVFDPRRFNSLGAKLARRTGAPLIPVACKTDFAMPGRMLRDFGPIDTSRPIRFAAGAALDSTSPQRVLQEACVEHVLHHLTSWNMPVAETADTPLPEENPS